MIFWTRCALQILQVHEALFGTQLIQIEKRKNDDTPARVVSWTHIGDLSAIRYGDRPHPKEQPQPQSRLPHNFGETKAFRQMTNVTQTSARFLNSHQAIFLQLDMVIRPIPRNNRTAGCHIFRRNQSVSTHLSQTQSVPEHVTRTDTVVIIFFKTYMPCTMIVYVNVCACV